MLIEQRNELMQKLNRDKNSDQVDADGDEIDEIQGKQLAAVENHLHAQAQVKLDKVYSSLMKIEQSTYGACEECEEDIMEKRLLFNPTFTLCIGCAEQAEKKLSEKRK